MNTKVSVYFSLDFVGAGHAFDTTRKSRWIADSLIRAPIPGIELVVPTPVTRELLAQVHESDYVRSVETGEPRGLAQSQGFPWDEGLWRMVLASNGGAVAAGLAALEHGVAGSLSSGLHHARRRCGAAFCTFNGLVLAATAAIAAGARSVLILDLDAHCGGGTASLIKDEPRITQIDVSVSWVDSYESTERAHLEMVDGPEYLATIRRLLERAGRFDLCLYNAGMDPYEGCFIGGEAGITKDVLAAREYMVFDWCRLRKLPIAFVLAGGYVGGALDEVELVRLHRLTLAAAADCEWDGMTQAGLLGVQTADRHDLQRRGRGLPGPRAHLDRQGSPPD
jgi:acetoin utilization deacetylase AcuC-like enzyme